MTDTHNGSRFNDEDIHELARSLESHDFDRIAPPASVWEDISAGLEEELAASEASARRRSRRWFNPSPMLAIAAATLLMVGVAAAVVSRSGNTARTDGEQVASASMTDADLPVATDETAQATVVCGGGRCEVDVDLTGLPEAGDDADLELWVINGDVTDMHSLGIVTESGRYPLPDGVTADDFPIVDISIEPRDGVAAHSGQSVLRGIFESI